MNAPVHRLPAWVMTALVLGAVALGALLGTALQRPDGVQAQQSTSSSGPVNSGQVLATAEAVQSAFQHIAEQVGPAVVTINAERRPVRSGAESPQTPFPLPFGDMLPPGASPRMRGMGSGVIVRPDGYVLTNDHVVAGADNVEVVLQDGRRLKGTVKRDFRSDIAVIKVDANNLPSARLGDSDSVRPGQWAIAIGSPFGKANTVTTGVVSAVGRREEIGDMRQGRFYPNLIQTDASINPGNSGGPLLNIRGEVVGINTAIESPSGAFAGIGFAVPINTARFVMEQLIEKGRVVRGYMGITPENVTPDDADRLGVKEGALVASVEDGSPAARAGVRVEDVIVSIDGKPIKGELDLRDLVARTAPGKAVDVVLMRDKKRETVKVTLGEAPDVGAAPGTPAVAEDGLAKLGLQAETLTENMADELKLPKSTRGAAITRVAPGSPADEAGLSRGDVVTRVNARAVTNAEDLSRAAAGLRSGERAVFIVRRPSQQGSGSTLRLIVRIP